MLSRRVIACLDVAGGEVVKGVRFQSLVAMGDPAALAARYEADGADEIVFLNIAAASDEAPALLDTVRRAAEILTIPLTVGGGISSLGQIETMLLSGADKVTINSAAFSQPSLITEAAVQFGSQCIVVSIDARNEGSAWTVYAQGGRARTEWDARIWAAECADRGAGEILITSIDRDGTRSGYDLALTRQVMDAVRVPVVASGG
nr:imidazole glycerol phosphate synthase cyclase subunit [Gemmatimonadota bacterium]